MAIPPLTKIKSSVFGGHHYDPDTRVLTLRFNSGKTYVHNDVPIEKYEALINNHSPGAYYGRKIRGVHLSREIFD